MKEVKCQDCSRPKDVEDNIKYPNCGGCGGVMVELKRKTLTNNTNKDDQDIVKEVFQRGVNKGRSPLADELIESVKVNKIKVNLE